MSSGGQWSGFQNFITRKVPWAYGVVVSMFDFHRSDWGSNPGRGGEKFHNVYDYTIERHPWQVSENHKQWVHPSHAREIG